MMFPQFSYHGIPRTWCPIATLISTNYCKHIRHQVINLCKIPFWCIPVSFLLSNHAVKGLVTVNSQHCRHTETTCGTTERKFGQISRTLSTMSIESKESSIQAPLTSILEIFHMPRLFRKPSLVNRKVCFQ